MLGGRRPSSARVLTPDGWVDGVPTAPPISGASHKHMPLSAVNGLSIPVCPILDTSHMAEVVQAGSINPCVRPRSLRYRMVQYDSGAKQLYPSGKPACHSKRNPLEQTPSESPVPPWCVQANPESVFSTIDSLPVQAQRWLRASLGLPKRAMGEYCEVRVVRSIV